MKPKHEFGKEAMENERLRILKLNKMKRTIKGSAILIVISAIFFLWGDIKKVVASSTQKGKSNSSKIDKKKGELISESPGISITQRWDLPKVLTEISGLAYLDQNRFLCIQDEQGTLFIYNTSTASIEKEIPFAGPGDYEGLTLVNQTAWVVRSDGHLYEIDDITAAKPVVKEYSTPLTIEQNIEGLCYDKKNNRLLLAIKDAEPGDTGYKGIYGFDLTSRKLATEPAFKIDLSNAIFSNQKAKKNKNDVIMPSAIAIHPISEDIYITDGRKAKLLILGSGGNIKNLYQLNSNEFAQPEGITFQPEGKMFISNEGPKKPANILQVEVLTH